MALRRACPTAVARRRHLAAARRTTLEVVTDGHDQAAGIATTELRIGGMGARARDARCSPRSTPANFAQGDVSRWLTRRMGLVCRVRCLHLVCADATYGGLYLQMVGRVLRPSPGKTHANLNDLSGSLHDQGPPDIERENTLDGQGISKLDRLIIRQCLECGAVFKTGPLACPLCLVVLPRKEPEVLRSLGHELIDTRPRCCRGA